MTECCRYCTFSGVLATHHCGHQIAAKNRLMSVTTLPSKLLMVFFQVINHTTFVCSSEVLYLFFQK